jgi:hypothetical protein
MNLELKVQNSKPLATPVSVLPAAYTEAGHGR